MGLTNAQKQAAHRARLRAKGLVHVQAWATPAQAAAIRAILSGEAAAVPASRPAAAPPLPLAKPAPRRSRKKKLSAAELERLQVTERNRDVIRQHQADVDRMEAGRVSRSALRAWLEERGADFGGKTTELNALLGPRSARAITS
jgi:hypothetical protein